MASISSLDRIRPHCLHPPEVLVVYPYSYSFTLNGASHLGPFFIFILLNLAHLNLLHFIAFWAILLSSLMP